MIRNRLSAAPVARLGAIVAVVAAVGLGAGTAGLPAAALAGTDASSAHSGSTTAGRIITAPTTAVGQGPGGLAVDPTTRTLYTSNANSNTVSVTGLARCTGRDARDCHQRAHTIRLPAGASPGGIAIDTATGTAYVADFATNTVSVINIWTCNATDFSGCGQVPTSVREAGNPAALAVDRRTDTIYVANPINNTVSVIDGAACNGHDPVGCAVTAPTVSVSDAPDAVAIDETTDTIYVASAGLTNVGRTVSVIDGATCNGTRHTGCAQTLGTVTVGAGPFSIAVDHASHTAYTANFTDSTVSVIDTSACDGTDHTGCHQKVGTIPVGTNPVALTIDPSLHTLYNANNNDDDVSAIDTSTCDAADRSGCRNRSAAMQVGRSPQALVTDPTTGTLYAANFDDDTVSVVDTATCDGTHDADCRHNASTAGAGAGPSGVALDARNGSLYVANATADTVALIDPATCSVEARRGCGRPAATIRLGSVAAALAPAGIAVDARTGTVYAADSGSDTVSVIDAATCNVGRRSGCAQHPKKIRVGKGPFAVAVDEVTDTVYVTNPASDGTGDTVSVIDGATCNATHSGGCGQLPVAVKVGDGPMGIAVNPATDTVYVTDTGQLSNNVVGDTVSVIDGATCNGSRHTGCGGHIAAITVGRYPFGIAINPITNTVYVADNDNGDGPSGLSVIDGAICDAARRSGCDQPARTVVEPGRSARNVALDVASDTLYVDGKSDASVSVIDLARPRSIAASPRVAVGSWPKAIAIDPTTHTAYVADDRDNTLSLIATS